MNRREFFKHIPLAVAATTLGATLKTATEEDPVLPQIEKMLNEGATIKAVCRGHVRLRRDHIEGLYVRSPT